MIYVRKLIQPVKLLADSVAASFGAYLAQVVTGETAGSNMERFGSFDFLSAGLLLIASLFRIALFPSPTSK